MGGVRPAPSGNLFPNVISKTGDLRMRITERLNQLKTTAVAVCGFIGGHRRLFIAVAAVLLIGGPLPPATEEAPTNSQSIIERR